MYLIMIIEDTYVSSFLVIIHKRSGRPQFIDLVLFSVIGLILPQNKTSFACQFRIVIPHWLTIGYHLFPRLILTHISSLLLHMAHTITKQNAALVVITLQTYVDADIPLELPSWLILFSCQPNDQLDLVALRFFVGEDWLKLFVGVDMPAGFSYIRSKEYIMLIRME